MRVNDRWLLVNGSGSPSLVRLVWSKHTFSDRLSAALLAIRPLLPSSSGPRLPSSLLRGAAAFTLASTVLPIIYSGLSFFLIAVLLTLLLGAVVAAAASHILISGPGPSSPGESSGHGSDARRAARSPPPSYSTNSEKDPAAGPEPDLGLYQPLSASSAAGAAKYWGMSLGDLSESDRAFVEDRIRAEVVAALDLSPEASRGVSVVLTDGCVCATVQIISGRGTEIPESFSWPKTLLESLPAHLRAKVTAASALSSVSLRPSVLHSPLLPAWAPSEVVLEVPAGAELGRAEADGWRPSVVRASTGLEVPVTFEWIAPGTTDAAADADGADAASSTSWLLRVSIPPLPARECIRVCLVRPVEPPAASADSPPGVGFTSQAVLLPVLPSTVREELTPALTKTEAANMAADFGSLLWVLNRTAAAASAPSTPSAPLPSSLAHVPAAMEGWLSARDLSAAAAFALRLRGAAAGWLPPMSDNPEGQAQGQAAARLGPLLSFADPDLESTWRRHAVDDLRTARFALYRVAYPFFLLSVIVRWRSLTLRAVQEFAPDVLLSCVVWWQWVTRGTGPATPFNISPTIYTFIHGLVRAQGVLVWWRRISLAVFASGAATQSIYNLETPLASFCQTLAMAMSMTFNTVNNVLPARDLWWVSIITTANVAKLGYEFPEGYWRGTPPLGKVLMCILVFMGSFVYRYAAEAKARRAWAAGLARKVRGLKA